MKFDKDLMSIQEVRDMVKKAREAVEVFSDFPRVR